MQCVANQKLEKEVNITLTEEKWLNICKTQLTTRESALKKNEQVFHYPKNKTVAEWRTRMWSLLEEVWELLG